MKKVVAWAVLGVVLLVLAGLSYVRVAHRARLLAAEVFKIPAQPLAMNKPARFTATAPVGAGGIDTMRARTTGRVRKMYFSGGEYVHRDALLAKLHNYNFVLAPRAGFLGTCLLTPGQWVRPATPVATLSHRDHLVLSLPAHLRHVAEGGWVVRVWVASRSDRVVSAVTDLIPGPDSLQEVVLPFGSPFRIGEQALVEWVSKPAAHLPAPPTAAPTRRSR